MRITDRFRHMWNVFRNRDPTRTGYYGGVTSWYQPYRVRIHSSNERTIINSIINRIAVDVSSFDIRHVDTDEAGRYLKTRKSSLNDRLSFYANIDQTGRQFIIDAVISLLDEGVVGLVPVVTDKSPDDSESFSIYELRTGKITSWYPTEVGMEVYDSRDGMRKQMTASKEWVAIIENPFYSVMNESNSTAKRLANKLALLDNLDNEVGTNKLNMVIQLPYVVRSKLKREIVDDRMKELETQLSSSSYGIGYIDSSEKIIQLNRPLGNNLIEQVKDLTEDLYTQLYMTKEILNGTADSSAVTNYQTKVVVPIVRALCEGMTKTFISDMGRSQGQMVMYFMNPFSFTPPTELANLADKLTRNEILTSNEIRQFMGVQPSKDPNADELRNKNLKDSTPIDHVKTTLDDSKLEERSDVPDESSGV